MLRYLLGALSAWVWLGVIFGMGSTAFAIESERGGALSDDDLLILQLRLGRFMLSDGLIGYRVNDDVCVILDDLVQALEFPIEATDEGATGWFIGQEHTFDLNLNEKMVSIKGKRSPIQSGDVYDDAGMICLSMKAASRWFPIDFSVEVENAIIVAKSRIPIPIEEREARKRRRAHTQTTKKATLDKAAAASAPYEWVGEPLIDTSFAFLTSSEQSSLSGDVLIVSEFLKTTSEAYVTSDDSGNISSVRARMGRRDPRKQLGGFLNLSEISVGDIAAPQSRLSTASKSGRGVLFSTFDLDRADVFDTTSLRGELQNGWEVELYRNGVLLDFRTSQPNGRYEFLSVPVLYGRNKFELRFYGPQGQKRVEAKDIYVGDSLLKKGKLNFMFAANQQDAPLFLARDTEGIDDAGASRMVGKFEYGLLKKLTLSLSGSQYTLDEIEKQYFDVGLRTTFAGIGVFLDGSKDINGGTAISTSLQASKFGSTLNAIHEEFSDYESEVVPLGGVDPIRRRNEARFDTVIAPFGWVSVPMSLSVERRESKLGAVNWDTSVRTSTNLGKIALSNELVYGYNRSSDGNTFEDLKGTLLFSRYTGLGSLRGELRYDALDGVDVTGLSGTHDLRFGENFGMRFGLDYDAVGHKTSYDAGISYRHNRFALGASARYAEEEGPQFALTLSTALGRVPQESSWVQVDRSMARSAAVVSRIFIDNDNNGIYSNPDEIVEGAKITVNGRMVSKSRHLGESVFVPNLPSDEPSLIQIDMRSIEDPYLLGPENGTAKAHILRPGRIIAVDLPLSRSGEVIGETLFFNHGSWGAVGDVQLVLLDEKGEVALSTKSEFDGFFVFERVPFGKYTLQVQAEQAAAQNLVQTTEHHFELSIDNDLEEGVRLKIVRSELSKDLQGDAIAELLHDILGQQSAKNEKASAPLPNVEGPRQSSRDSEEPQPTRDPLRIVPIPTVKPLRPMPPRVRMIVPPGWGGSRKHIQFTNSALNPYKDFENTLSAP